MRRLLMLTLVIGALATPAQATPLYYNDFDNPVVLDSGVGFVFGPYSPETAAAGPWNAAGWSGTYAANRTAGNPAVYTTLLLSGLAPHTFVSGSFILGFLESWDSYDGGCCSPDNLEVWIDGVQVSNMTANNALGTVEDFDGSTVVAHYQQTNSNLFYSDTLVNTGTAPFMTFAHSAPTLTISIRASGAGWQGGDDEAWGIDNIKLDYDGVHDAQVPEPGSLLLLGGGLATFIARRRFGKR